MDLYNQAFQEALSQNAVNEEKWQNYKDNVNETRENANTFLKSCKLDIMVPIGKKAFIRGTLQHTNDILVSHSPNYFSVVSNHQANEILQHRNQICVQRLQEINKEKELFRGKLDAPRNDAFSENEIIEEYNEEAEMEWRRKHRESVKKHKMQEASERNIKTDSEVNDLLEKYELMEELTGELENLEENPGYDYDQLLKLINGETKVPESKTRIAHEPTESCNEHKLKEVVEKVEIPQEKPEATVEPAKTSQEILTPKTKRKVRFSTSLEDVKIIEEDIKSEQTAFPAIQIKFHHSSEKFNPDIFEGIDDDIKIKHPGEVFKILNDTNQEHPKTKSILKETNYRYDPKEVKSSAMKHNSYDDEEVFETLSKFPLICGDVVERKQEENIIPVGEVKSGKKVSKFKELRNKVK